MKLKFLKLIEPILNWVIFSDYSYLNKMGRIYYYTMVLLSIISIAGIIYCNI